MNPFSRFTLRTRKHCYLISAKIVNAPKGKSSEIEFQFEELQLKYEEQDEKMEKFRAMAKEKIESLEANKTSLEQQVDQGKAYLYLINKVFRTFH